MAGLLPLSYTTIRDWAVLMDIGELEPYEVDALMTIDAAMFTDDGEPKKEDAVKLPEEVARPRWPKQKAPK